MPPSVLVDLQNRITKFMFEFCPFSVFFFVVVFVSGFFIVGSGYLFQALKFLKRDVVTSNILFFSNLFGKWFLWNYPKDFCARSQSKASIGSSFDSSIQKLEPPESCKSDLQLAFKSQISLYVMRRYCEIMYSISGKTQYNKILIKN